VDTRKNIVAQSGEQDESPRHILSEVGWNVRQVSDELHGAASIIPQLLVPGTQQLRTSMLAAWADQLMGLLAVRIVSPRVPTVRARSEEGLNSANTINGGLLAVAAEEAVLSLCPGAALCSLALRYLRPVRIGPAVATARLRNGLALVELADAGDGNRLAVTATARTFGTG
jgi:acyl-coenzyme A thioesterase PaaI-like protein